MEIIIVFLVCLLLLNLFKKSKVEDISEARLNEIRNLISNWYNSLHEFCKITEDHSKIIAKHEKDFLKAYRFHMLKVQEELSTLK